MRTLTEWVSEYNSNPEKYSLKQADLNQIFAIESRQRGGVGTEREAKKAIFEVVQKAKNREGKR